jgi:hypothetical protein
MVKLNKYLTQWGLTQGEIVVGCDNLSALRYSVDTCTFPTISGSVPDFDVITSTRSCLLPGITYRWKHVKGHQDLKRIELDYLAKQIYMLTAWPG